MTVLLPFANPLVALDDGHGMSTAGKRTPEFPKGSGLKSETGNFMHENEFNRAVVKYLKEELNRCGIRTIEVAPGDSDVPLGTRTKKANDAKAHLYLSVHANAATGKWGTANGIETLVGKDAKAQALAKVFHRHIKGGTPQRDRGLKDGAWLGIVQTAKMPTLLFEFGFMDNLEEAKLLLSDAYRRECARELAQATCEVFGKKYVPATQKPATKPTSEPAFTGTLKGIGKVVVLVESLNLRSDASFVAPVLKTLTKGQEFYVYSERNGLYNLGGGWASANPQYVKFTPHPKPSGLYKVQVGAFSNEKYAKNLSDDLKNKAFTNYVKKVGNLYKVQVGAFSLKQNAEVLEKQLQALGHSTMIVFE